MQRQVQSVATVVLAALMVASVQPALADDPRPAPSPAESRIVNVTSDSAPGWRPSTDQARAASEAALAYLAAKDAGRAEAAYAMLEDGNKALQPFADFARDLNAFNNQAGAVIERRITTVTWTKDPAQAPKPGVYAAIDIIGRFANIDRDCGYLIVYEPPAGGPFRVSREEANFMTNAEATRMERQQSKAAVESAWRQLAKRCPSYSEDYTSVLSGPGGASPLPEQTDSSIGYSTVTAALTGLRARPNVVWRTENGFTIATDDASNAIWVFASEGQPAYPAAIKRQIVVDGDGGTSLDMSVLCEASKAACDDLVRTFEALNARMTADLRGGR